MGREGSSPRVLHVDDDEEYADMVAMRLASEADLSVETESTVADTLERLEAEPFDCLVSDYRLPDADGIELVRRVRENHPDLPIVILTGRGSEQVASEAISAGVTDYFRKATGSDRFELLANRIERAVDRYRAEQALREERSRNDEFVRLVAHDLRNPLAVANGWLEVLGEDADEEVARSKALDALGRMADIIDNLEALARSGETETDDERVELSAIATAAWEPIEAASAALHVEYGPELAADPSMLQQALENLFENAVEHGGEAVTIEVGATDDGFYVADDGTGIDPGDREKVFESGYTADGGTGLGLAIVERIADAHGWDVDVTDGETGGARFEFEGVRIERPETA